MPSSQPSTVGELKASGYKTIPVRNELRNNLVEKLRAGYELFPGIVGYGDTVVPQLVNAVLARHDFILLGLRGQAKSRILRQLVELMDPELPILAGSEVNDDPLNPISKHGRLLVEELGDEAAIEWIPREYRYVEKLATPDVTIADMLGDVDPIKAARGGHILADELTIHYGLLPRANRGVFAINELPDLAGKIQVGLFNILQEGDVQIKGYPVRLRLDIMMAFTANPEDYTARGKIVTPLKDRIGSEIRTHYPQTRHDAMAITEQEAWVDRDATGSQAQTSTVPPFVREVVEEIAFQARSDQKIDLRSGVSQRLPISCLENVVSNAERRAVTNSETDIVARVTDIYAALPSITGKFELEYEGELRGADAVARDLVRSAVRNVFTGWFDGIDTHRVVEWFELGGSLQISDTTAAADLIEQVKEIQGLTDLAAHVGGPDDGVAARAATMDFILEGLYADKKISRTDEWRYHAAEEPRRSAQSAEQFIDANVPLSRSGNKKNYYN
jgi:magnesium chelatase subunit I